MLQLMIIFASLLFPSFTILPHLLSGSNTLIPSEFYKMSPAFPYHDLPKELLHLKNVRKEGNYLTRQTNESPQWTELHFITRLDSLANGTLVSLTLALIGSIHRLRLDLGMVPHVHIAIHGEESSLAIASKLSGLARVQVHLISKHIFSDDPSDILGFIRLNISSQSSILIWVEPGYILDPLGDQIQEADRWMRASIYEDLYTQAQGKIVSAIKNLVLDSLNNVRFVEESGKMIALASAASDNNWIDMDPTRLYLRKYETSDTFQCHLEGRAEMFTAWVNSQTPLQFDPKFKERDIAIGVPVSSKGLSRIEESALLTTLVPSVIKTCTEQELNRLALFIGYDEGDPIFDNRETRVIVENTCAKKGLSVIIWCPLPRIGRVAQLWNFLAARVFSVVSEDVLSQDSSIKYKFKLFYQVNDDLEMISPGWVTAFSHRLLIEQNGVGVVGPADPHNSLACIVLTQAMVSWKHWEAMYSQFLYLPAFADWKSDRWLTHLYKKSTNANESEHYKCFEKIVAKNGAKATRYEHCDLPDWTLWLERGKERVKQYLESENLQKKKGAYFTNN